MIFQSPSQGTPELSNREEASVCIAGSWRKKTLPEKSNSKHQYLCDIPARGWQLGWKLLERVLHYVPGSKFRCWYIFDCDLEHINNLAVELPLAWERVRKDDLHLLQQVNPAVSYREAEWRWQQGNYCYLALYQGEPVFYLWVYVNRSLVPLLLNQVTQMQVEIALLGQEAYFWDVWTKEEYRGKGISPWCQNQICRELKAQGTKKVLTVISYSNQASIRSVEKIGFQFMRKLLHLQLCGRDLVRGRWQRREMFTFTGGKMAQLIRRQ